MMCPDCSALRHHGPCPENVLRLGTKVTEAGTIVPVKDLDALRQASCNYPNCARECAGGPCPYCRDDDAPICKDKGGSVGMNGECLYCTAEAGEACK